VDISLFDYYLPRELIAQFPGRRRDLSRLMVLNRADGAREHTRFKKIAQYFNRGDVIVVNDTRVFKARLWGHRATGGRTEVFLVRKLESERVELWEALVSPSGRLNEGEQIYFSENAKIQLVTAKGNGKWCVSFGSPSERKHIISHFGHVPLPHYISREDGDNDVRRYQTVFADRRKVGAVAAPTAGFHFTKALLEQLHQKGVERIELTLHVGPGTFKPVKCDRIEDHTVDPEYAELSPEAARRLNVARERGGAIFAVGTTSVRTLESAETKDGEALPFSGMVDTYIRPGYKFRLVDHLITNFHLPKSSLLILVSAFAGREKVLEAYREAIREGYRFYSYGDAMLIL
jgi:S-adenosylmethionine:tRNA ribosyltransferase-isomerase